MSSRPRHTARSASNPLESLIHTIIPSLAPPSKSREPAEGRIGRASVASIRSGVERESRPSSRGDVDQDDEERERIEKVRELVEWCEEIMDR